MATLGTTFLGAYLSMGGKKAADPGPPLNAKSKEEESFIKYLSPIIPPEPLENPYPLLDTGRTGSRRRMNEC